VTAAQWAEDDALIDQLLAAGQTGTGPYSWSTSCRWCGHNEHGFRCSKACPCDGHNVTRTDEWRPPREFAELTQTRLMHDYGVDGWSAYAIAGQNLPGKYEPPSARNTARTTRIRWAIKGEPKITSTAASATRGPAQ